MVYKLLSDHQALTTSLIGLLTNQASSSALLGNLLAKTLNQLIMNRETNPISEITHLDTVAPAAQTTQA